MAIVTKSRKIKRRRLEGVWTLVLSGVVGSCLAVVAVKQMPMMPLASWFSSTPKTIQIGAKPGTGTSQQATPRPLIDDDEIRTGSIVVQIRRDDCEHRLFDNYTGQIWAIGTVSCEAALSRHRDSKSGPERLQAIGSAFRPAR